MAKVQKRTALPHSVTRMGTEISTTGSSLRVSASGIEQSVIDLSRPKTIEFEYLQHMDVLLDMANEAWSIPHLRAFHGGAGACALPLAWEAKHPAMSQVAVEVDPELVEVVGRAAGLKRKPRLKLRVGDAEKVLAGSGAKYNVIVRDAFVGPRTPRHLTTRKWTNLVASRLLDEGVYLVNVGRDRTAPSKEEVATVLDIFAVTTVVTDPKVWRGDRGGNLVVAGWVGLLPDFDELDRVLRRLPLPARLYRTDEVRRWLGGAQPIDH